MREDDTGPQELITLNNGEQIKNNLCRMGEISRGSSESETFIGHKIYLQNLTYIMWGEEEEGEWGVSGIWACACVLGEGRIGVKVRKKRRQRQTKRKSEEKGVGSNKMYLFTIHLLICVILRFRTVIAFTGQPEGVPFLTSVVSSHLNVTCELWISQKLPRKGMSAPWQLHYNSPTSHMVQNKFFSLDLDWTAWDK